MIEELQVHTPSACNAALSAVGDTLYAIGGKWKIRIIIALQEGPRRFNDLQRVIPGISARVLSNDLKELELNGFLRRNVDTGKPVVVTYELTEYADTLKDIIGALSDWGRKHRDKIRRREV